MGKNIPRDGKSDDDEGKAKSAGVKGKQHHNSKIVIAFRNIINELLNLRIKSFVELANGKRPDSYSNLEIDSALSDGLSDDMAL